MTENSIQGNGNWYYTDGQWISDEGADLSGGNPFAGGGDSSGGNPFAGGGDGSGGNPFAGGGDSSGGNPFTAGDGGNVSTTSDDGQYTHNYTRTEDERSVAPDGNNPFSQLIDILSVDTNSSDSNSNVFGGENNPPENLSSGSTAPSSTNENFLPEAPEGLSVPYNSDNWISDLKDLESGEAGASTGANTGNGNGNWFYGSNNTADGNGNWYFGSGNTTDGNGNWEFGNDNTANGNGNWEFGSRNTSDGNGNWQLGDDNTVNGNANTPSGDRNSINGNSNILSGNSNNVLGNTNTGNINNGGLLGNSIEATDDGKAYIGNEDWSFDILDELTSLEMGVSGVGSDVKRLLSHPDLVSTTTSKEGYTDSAFLTNSDYQFEFSGL
ncbi:hypothetical protein [Nodularia sphaerocarpa]|uniref:hypothetical protein n=1 Tax=Nodularia sphaerocarpa TaxID=137816 RepID=UPI00232DEDE7|nr:hypothetical protein [Nodularia sphaerocarpa]MDB9376069.1 hypothetical protein [Nodularia sphaerocarpa CS-585]MDB9379937.1 hypothetical protein [Nodularia sphaerocarpa CS-585A2]